MIALANIWHSAVDRGRARDRGSGRRWLKVALAAILSRFRASLLPGTLIDYRVAITMRPRKAVAAIWHPRDGVWAAAPVKGQIRGVVAQL